MLPPVLVPDLTHLQLVLQGCIPKLLLDVAIAILPGISSGA